MSYCVNCGVKLAPSEKKCPLCGVPVQNPAAPWTEPLERPYPRYVETVMRKIDRRYGAALASILLMIPVGVTLIANLISSGALTWSWYVVGGVMILFIAVLFPMLFTRPDPIFCELLDMAVILFYLAMIDWLFSPERWFWPLAFPLVAVSFAFIIALTAILRSKRRPTGLYSAALCVFAAGVLSVLINIIVSDYLESTLLPSWSWYVLVPCLVMGMVLCSIERRNKLKEEIRRRLYL